MSAEPRPSATLVLIRDVPPGLELLLLQKSPRRDGQPGAWVFPGGKIEPRDRTGAGDAPIDPARRAAARETLEETGLSVRTDAMRALSRWITPEIAPRRFDTWFFLARVDAGSQVRVDGSEICTHRWLAPVQALAAHSRGEIPLAPPTFVTVTWLTGHSGTSSALTALARGPFLTFRPRICRSGNGTCILYPGDAGYDSGDPDRPGARHRLWMSRAGWRYERSDEG